MRERRSLERVLKLFETFTKGVRTFQRRSREAAEHARLRLENASLQRERSELYKRLGREVFLRYQQGAALPEGLEPVLKELSRLEGEIHSKREAVAAALARIQQPRGAEEALPPPSSQEG